MQKEAILTYPTLIELSFALAQIRLAFIFLASFSNFYLVRTSNFLTSVIARANSFTCGICCTHGIFLTKKTVGVSFSNVKPSRVLITCCRVQYFCFFGMPQLVMESFVLQVKHSSYEFLSGPNQKELITALEI